MVKNRDTKTAQSGRADRLADELKANLARRKAQMRERSAGDLSDKPATDEAN